MWSRLCRGFFTESLHYKPKVWAHSGGRKYLIKDAIEFCYGKWVWPILVTTSATLNLYIIFLVPQLYGSTILNHWRTPLKMSLPRQSFITINWHSHSLSAFTPCYVIYSNIIFHFPWPVGTCATLHVRRAHHQLFWVYGKSSTRTQGTWTLWPVPLRKSARSSPPGPPLLTVAEKNGTQNSLNLGRSGQQQIK